MKATRSTRQVTKAMELVSASKMRKAVKHAQQLRRYALSAWKILQSIAHSKGKEPHPFTTEKPVKNVLAILVSTDRSLCGSLNSQIFRAATQYVNGLKEIKTFEKIDFLTIGRKGTQFVQRQHHTSVAAFPALSNHPQFKDILPIAKVALDEFANGTYDHVVIVYTEFISALAQEATVKPLLPFAESDMTKMIGGIFERKKLTKEEQEIAEQKDPNVYDYTFEPSPEEVLDVILPQLTEIQMFHSVLESAASEWSARMVAMRNASDNASGLLDDLTLTYNQTRQAIITAELAELSASKAALD